MIVIPLTVAVLYYGVLFLGIISTLCVGCEVSFEIPHLPQRDFNYGIALVLRHRLHLVPARPGTAQPRTVLTMDFAVPEGTAILVSLLIMDS